MFWSERQMGNCSHSPSYTLLPQAWKVTGRTWWRACVFPEAASQSSTGCFYDNFLKMGKRTCYKDRYKQSQHRRIGIGNLHFHKHLGDSYTHKCPRNTALCLSLRPHRVLLIGGWSVRELGRLEWFPLVSSFLSQVSQWRGSHSPGTTVTSVGWSV